MKLALRIPLLSFFLFLSCREPSTEQPQPQSKPSSPTAATNEDEFLPARGEGRRRGPDRDGTSVRLKLKRDPKDGYTWELSGNDPKEVLKVDKQLRRELLSKQEKRESPD